MELSEWLTILAILVTAWTIYYQVDKTRKLSRKTTAISLLSEQFMMESWFRSLGLITSMKMDHGDFDWKAFAKKKFTVGHILEDNEKEVSHAARDVLNYFEFVSIAILTHSANEDIIHASLGDLMVMIYDELNDYICEARKINNANDVYVNYQSIVEKWKEKPNTARPVE